MTRHLREALRSGRFVLTAELTPPLSGKPDDLLRAAAPLQGLADAVNVTDGASARVHMSALAAAALLARAGIEPVLQVTCRDRNRIALQSDAIGAAALGIRNLLILRGDDPAAGDQPEAKPVFDLDPRQVMRTIRMMRDEGKLPSGRPVTGLHDLLIGAADTPIDPAPGWAPEGLRAKLEAGAQFVQTQFCMDAAIVRRYAARLQEHGVTVPLLIGIAPLASARSARWMRERLHGTIIPDAVIERMERAPDPKAEGRRVCLELLDALADVPGVTGAHIMAPLNEAAVPAILEAFRRNEGGRA